jgi:nicotinamide-nucleotide amidase
VAGEREVQLVGRLQSLCLERGITVATAESCTGGLVAKLITDQAGASSYFKGGVVSYANEAKTGLLGVMPDLLQAHGAVSAQVARVMASEVRIRLQADVGVSVTGVSGPGGGTAAKPVGLAYVAVSDGEGEAVRRFVWSGDRDSNRHASAEAALELLLDRLGSAADHGTGNTAGRHEAAGVRNGTTAGRGGAS